MNPRMIDVGEEEADISYKLGPKPTDEEVAAVLDEIHRMPAEDIDLAKG